MDNDIRKAPETSYELIAPCHFGLEAVLKKEIIGLGYEIVSTQDGRITFRGDETAIPRANIFVRTAERILLKMGSFKAETFDGLKPCYSPYFCPSTSYSHVPSLLKMST